MLLTTLDLSYNQLEVEGCVGADAPLAALPVLAELNLSGNAWRRLPHTLGPFSALELLKLSDNLLTGASLVPLAALPRLTSLSLSRNPGLEGLEGVSGKEDSAKDALRGAGLCPDSSFPALKTLDLSHCHVHALISVEPLRWLPCLRQLLLAGNPLAQTALQVQKRAEQRRAMAAVLAADGAVLRPHELDEPSPDPFMVFAPIKPQGPRPTVASVLTGAGGHHFRVHEALGRKSAERAATLATVLAVPEEAVSNAFERTAATIEAWQLNSVPEEEEEEEEEEDCTPVEDNTFLTGVGITESHKPSRGKATQEVLEAADDDRPEWEDVTDPTERLALALGLDPRRLAINTGIATSDAAAAAAALRYALAHPLVEVNEGLDGPARYLGMTVTAKAKRRERSVRLLPLPAGANTAAVQPPPDMRALKVQTVEGMLEGMKARLAALEGTLTQRLAAAGVSIGKRSAEGLERRDSGLTEFEEEPDSPEAHTGNSPQLSRPRPGEGEQPDDASEMSALPDDVMDAIENSDASDDESDDFAVPDDDPPAALNTAGAALEVA
ncbi:hypothetical protein V8C86DRAFT_967616 [Haematococcus lacustris]